MIDAIILLAVILAGGAFLVAISRYMEFPPIIEKMIIVFVAIALFVIMVKALVGGGVPKLW